MNCILSSSMVETCSHLNVLFTYTTTRAYPCANQDLGKSILYPGIFNESSLILSLKSSASEIPKMCGLCCLTTLLSSFSLEHIDLIFRCMLTMPFCFLIFPFVYLAWKLWSLTLEDLKSIRQRLEITVHLPVWEPCPWTFFE